MTTLDLVLGFTILVSVVLNIFLVWYAKTSLTKINTLYTASEETSEIFTLVDTYNEHLQSVYEMPTFYGDETLQSLLDHTKQLVAFLKKYEHIYSFTQPDLEEQLSAASLDLEQIEQDEEAEKAQE